MAEIKTRKRITYDILWLYFLTSWLSSPCKHQCQACAYLVATVTWQRKGDTVSDWQLAFLNHPLTAGLAAQTKDRQEEASRRRKGKSKVNAASEDQQKNKSEKKKKYSDRRTVSLSLSALITTLSGQMSVCVLIFIFVVITQYPIVDATAQP